MALARTTVKHAISNAANEGVRLPLAVASEFHLLTETCHLDAEGFPQAGPKSRRRPLGALRVTAERG